MKRVERFRIVEHGVEHEQYFQGHSVWHNNYTETSTGCGSTATEALEDAIEQAVCGGELVFTSEQTTEITEYIEALAQQYPEPAKHEDHHWYISLDTYAKEREGVEL